MVKTEIRVALVCASKKHLLNDKEVYYSMGLGCKYHDNCFTCPYDDCIAKCKTFSYTPIITNTDMLYCKDTSTVTMRTPAKKNKKRGK